jgi:hypothetical protein
MMDKRSLFRAGGFIATAILIIGGIVTMVVGVNTRSDVRDKLSQEQITGSPDMTPAGIKVEAAKAGLSGVTFPTCSVANKEVKNGDSARCFADYMRIHALEATAGKPYSQLDHYLKAGGGTTNDATQAAKDPKSGKPLDNPIRNVWVTETALSTALNTSFFAESVSTFALWMGLVIVLIGIGLLVNLFGLASAEKERRESA